MISEIFFEFKIPVHLLFEDEPHHTSDYLIVEAKTSQSGYDIAQILEGGDPQVDSIKIISMTFSTGSPYSSSDLTGDAIYTIKEYGCTEAKRFCVEYAFNVTHF